MNRVFVVGVGMTKFEKPGSRKWDYPDIGIGGDVVVTMYKPAVA